MRLRIDFWHDHNTDRNRSLQIERGGWGVVGMFKHSLHWLARGDAIRSAIWRPRQLAFSESGDDRTDKKALNAR